jgi:hypothetical protein
MNSIPIAELKPELPDLDTKQFKAIVTLIWPWSSSARQFALLLVEPEFRLRRRNGQVRARFSGSSARAIANTGVGIGDEVVLSLRGASFVRGSSVNTPGKSIDYELEYKQTVAIQVTRDGTELANLELTDVTPTPLVGSPVRRAVYKPFLSAIEEPKKWASPAFLKRTRLDHGPVFEAGYDPFEDDTEDRDTKDRHEKKRRRMSYKDWNAWTYSARTPSPEKEDAAMEDYDVLTASPIRQAQAPYTPASPVKLHQPAESQLQQHDIVNSGNDGLEDEAHATTESEKKYVMEENVHDNHINDLYDGASELPALHTQYAFEGDTEPNTEEEDEAPASVHQSSHIAVAEVDSEEDDVAYEGVHQSSHIDVAEVDSEKEEAEHTPSSDVIESISDEEDFNGEIPDEDISDEDNSDEDVSDQDVSVKDNEVLQEASSNVIDLISNDYSSEEEGAAISIEEKSMEEVGVEAPTDAKETAIEQAQRARERSGTHEDPIVLDDDDEEDDELPNAMAPPALPLLQTNFQTTLTLDIVTPIGREPQSPNLKPLDSATLPIPSPFPRERDEHISSKFEISSPSKPDTRRQHQHQPETEADDIIESSFYSSVGSSTFHESAFTDVRFMFGMDGSAFSRPEVLPDSYNAESGVNKPAQEAAAEVDMSISQTQGDELEMLDFPESEQDLTFEEAQEMPISQANIPTESPSTKGTDASEEAIVSSGAGVGNDEDQSGIVLDTLNSEPVQNVTIDKKDQSPMAKQDQESLLTHVHPEEQSQPVEEGGEVALLQPISPPVGGTGYSLVEEQAGTPIANTQISEIIDLGSSSGVESDEEALPAEAYDSAIQSDDSEDEDVMEIAPYTAERTDSAEPPGQSGRHPQQGSELGPNFDESDLMNATSRDGQSTIPDDNQESMNGNGAYDHLPDASDGIVVHPELSSYGHPDVKMESIEEQSTLDWMHQQSPQPKLSIEEPSDNHEGNVVIAVPEEGHKLGELHFKSVPSTAPARNTRSKTKASMSPVKDDQSMSQPTPRPRKGRTFVTPIARARMTLSPVTGVSPSLASPYSLRSQSKLLSPTKSTAFGTQIESPRKRSTNYANSQPAIPDTFESADLEFPNLSFERLQELDNSQGRFSNVSYVKDSEDGSSHCENSLSTVKYSDDWDNDMQDFTNFSDPVEVPDTKMRDGESPLMSRPAERGLLSETQTRTSTTPTKATSNSLRQYHRPRKDVYDLPSDEDERPGSVTPKQTASTSRVTYPVLPDEDEDKQSGNLPPPSNQSDGKSFDRIEEYIASLPPASQSKPASIKLQSHSLMNNTMPMTPEASQLTSASQPSFSAAQQEQSMPITPQLTQTTSAGLRSFKVDTTEPLIPTTIARQSELELELPSTGLSTPIAYYTPLKDLPFFLNRSSQFHSSSHPDVLALVTSSTTPAKQAEKGPKHWTTTLRITDLSSYPSTTIVRIFRAYATALPVAQKGDVVLLRAFSVKSLNRQPTLVSGEESAWCVWKYSVMLWGTKRIAFGEVRGREEVKGPEVERGEGEWREVERLRGWWKATVEKEVEKLGQDQDGDGESVKMRGRHK